MADNGVIKAKNTITVGENPPSTNLKQGDLWWNSNEDNGRLYVYYEDENTQQWIDASPQGGNLEQDQADTLYLSKKNDDTAAGNITFDKDIYVKQSAGIGGTTADPNIQLNADGVIRFANSELGQYGDQTFSLKNTNNAPIDFFTNNTQRMRLNNVGDVLIGGTLPLAPNISLFNHGGAEFNGAAAFRRNNPTINQAYFIAQDSSDNKVKLLASQESLYLGNDVQATAGNPISGANITLNAGGSISSNGAHLIYRENAEDAVVNGYLNKTRTLRIAADGTTQIGGTLGGNLATNAPNISLNANGSASLTRIGFKPLSDSDAFIQATNQTTGKIVANHYGNGDITLSSDLVAESKIRLNGSDGSATFTGAVSGGNWDVTTAQENWYIADGLLAIAKSGTQPDSGTITVYSGAGINNTFRVRADGGVEVGGTIPSAPNISLNADGTIIAKDAASRHQLGRKTDVATNSVLKVSSQNIDGTNDKDRFIIDKAGNVFIGDLTEVGNASPTGANISLNANGTIQAGGDANAGVAGTKIFSEGSITVCRNGTDVAFNTKAEGSTTTTSQILADGSATFAGTVQAGTNTGVAGSGQGWNFRSGGFGYQFVAPGTESDVVFEQRMGDLRVHSRTRDGSATFAGSLFAGPVQNFSLDTCEHIRYDNAKFQIGVPKGTTTAAFQIMQGQNSIGASVSAAINGDGSATFAGDINAGNVTFDADTADAINVRERLVEARERLEKARETFQELQVAVANSNDFSDLKAAMMVALEDYVDGGN